MGAVWFPVAHLTSVPLSSAQPENTWTFYMAQHLKDCELVVFSSLELHNMHYCFGAAITLLLLLIVMMLKQYQLTLVIVPAL